MLKDWRIHTVIWFVLSIIWVSLYEYEKLAILIAFICAILGTMSLSIDSTPGEE